MTQEKLWIAATTLAALSYGGVEGTKRLKSHLENKHEQSVVIPAADQELSSIGDCHMEHTQYLVRGIVEAKGNKLTIVDPRFPMKVVFDFKTQAMTTITYPDENNNLETMFERTDQLIPKSKRSNADFENKLLTIIKDIKACVPVKNEEIIATLNPLIQTASINQ